MTKYFIPLLILLHTLTVKAGVRCFTADEAIIRGCIHDAAQDHLCAPALSFDSCSYEERPTDLALSIAGLKDDESLPMAIFTGHSTEEIARAIVYRMFLNHEAFDVLNPSLNFYKQGEVQLAFSSKIAALIFKNGFLNQHQVGTSAGHYKPQIRAGLEDKLIGLKIEEHYSMSDSSRLANELRPKYAFLGLPANASGVEPGLFEIDYGDVFAVFKPEVKQRSTFSNGDTLNHDGSPQLEKHSFKYSPQNLFLPRLGSYYEVQIWGKLTIDDVAYFLVDCPGFYDTDKAFFEAYRAAGITTPIYKCESIEPHGAGGAKQIRPSLD